MNTKNILSCLLIPTSFAIASCNIVDAVHFESLDPANIDAGTDAETDAGPTGPQAVDLCGSPDVFVFSDTTSSIVIDTRNMGAESTPNCGGSTTAAGKDAFFAIDVTAGQFWHFHLRPDSTVEGWDSLDPYIYMLQDLGASCNANACNPDQASDVCGSGTIPDEHFAFTASSSGRWYIGIDDRGSNTGGVYLLDAILPICGDDTQQHGEACDNGPTGDSSCDNRCRAIIGDGTATEINETESNDTIVESNVFTVPSGNVIDLVGGIGGGGVCYPDYFAFRVPSGFSTMAVTAMIPETENVCTAETDAPYRLIVLNAAGTTLGTSDTGCPALAGLAASEGEYTIRLSADDAEIFSAYKLRVTLTP